MDGRMDGWMDRWVEGWKVDIQTDGWSDRCLKKKQTRALERGILSLVPQFCCCQLTEKVAPGGRALHVCPAFPFGRETLKAALWLQALQGEVLLATGNSQTGAGTPLASI